ncbi:MAG: hypothetical protein IKH16_09330 [Selenomonadaceae bacterium]|nr:hypothetical protein [Selenomonadaceae bacterium]
MRYILKILITVICGLGMFFGLPTIAVSPNIYGVAEASDVWAYTDHSGEYYVRTETIKDKYIEPSNRKYTKQWFQVNVKQVRNGRLVIEQPWSFMQMRNGSWGYNPYPLLAMNERAEAIWKVAMSYR